MFAGRELKANDFDVLHLLHEHSSILVSALRRARDLLSGASSAKTFHVALNSLYQTAEETLNNLGGENSVNNYERISEAVLNNHRIFLYINAFTMGLSAAMEEVEYRAYIPLYEQMQDMLATVLTDPDSLKNRMEKMLRSLRSYNSNAAHMYDLFDAENIKHLDLNLAIMIAEFSYAISHIAELNVSINADNVLNDIYETPSVSLLEIIHTAIGIQDANAKQQFLEEKLRPIISAVEADLKKRGSSDTLQYVDPDVEEAGVESAPVNLNFEYSAKLIVSLENKVKKLNKNKYSILSEASVAIQKIRDEFNAKVFLGNAVSIAESKENANNTAKSAMHYICKQRNVQLDSLVNTIELYQHHIRSCKKFLKDLESCGKLFSKIENKIQELYGNFLLMHASTMHIFIHYFLQDNIQKIKLAMPLPETGDASWVERRRFAALCVLLSNVKRTLDENENTPKNLAGFLDEIIASTHVDPDKDLPDQFSLNQSLKAVFYAIPDIKNAIHKSAVKSWYKAAYNDVENDILLFMATYSAANIPDVFRLLLLLKDNINYTKDTYALDRHNRFFATNYYAVGSEILSTIMKVFAAETNEKCIEFSARLSMWSHAIKQYGIFNSGQIADKISVVADIFSETKEKYSRHRIT
jgi:hypothetical protein